MAPQSPHLRLVAPPEPEPAPPSPPLPGRSIAEHAPPTGLPRPDPDARTGGEAVSEATGEATFAAIFAQHGRFVAQVVLRVLGRDADVDDVVQEVFLTALSGLSAVRSPQAVRAWLKTVAVRKAMRHLRRRRLRLWLGLERSPPHCGEGDEAADPYARIAAPGCCPEQRALLRRVYRCLDELPAAERVAWTLRHVEGEPLDDVAALCGCSLATAKRRIAAAHAALEGLFADE